MRSKLLLLLPIAGCLFLASCASVQETGIPRSQAIKIAKAACPEYPLQFGFVDRAEWVSEKGFWIVLLEDQPGFHGRVYEINRDGQIVGTHDIDRGHPPAYYYGYDGPGPYYYGGPPVVVGVYGGGPGWYGRGPGWRRW